MPLSQAIMGEKKCQPSLINAPESDYPLIQYALRVACKDPKLTLNRAFECSVNPATDRDFGRKSGATGVKTINGYVTSTTLKSCGSLNTICRNGFKKGDNVKFYLGSIGDIIEGDIVAKPLGIPKTVLYDENGDPLPTSNVDESNALSMILDNPNSTSSTSAPSNESAPQRPKSAAEYIPRAALRCKVCVQKPFITYDEGFFRCSQIPDEYDSMVLIEYDDQIPGEYQTSKADFLKSIEDATKYQAKDHCADVTVAEGKTDRTSSIIPRHRSNRRGFRATYVVRDLASQIIPEYYLEFDIAEILEDEKNTQMCGSCPAGMEKKAVFCIEEDGWLFCEPCLEELFKKLPMMRSQRTVVSVGDMKPTFARCSEHTDRTAEWWCGTCHRALCVTCKVSGSHSKRAEATHVLEHIKDKYEKVKQLVTQRTPAELAFRQKIDRDIDLIDRRTEKVQENVQTLLRDLHARAEALENDILKLGATKLDRLRTRRHLATRNLSQIEWATQFATYISDHTVMEAESFLESSKWHEKFLSGLLENCVSVDEEQFLPKADLQLNGQLQVRVLENPDCSRQKSISPQKLNKTRPNQHSSGGRSQRLSNSSNKENASPALSSSNSPCPTGGPGSTSERKKEDGLNSKIDDLNSSIAKKSNLPGGFNKLSRSPFGGENVESLMN